MPFAAGDEHLAVFVEQQYRGRVRSQCGSDPLEQLAEQVLQREVCERGIRQPLELLEPLLGGVRRHCDRRGRRRVAARLQPLPVSHVSWQSRRIQPR
jgi:hypothetical protein